MSRFLDCLHTGKASVRPGIRSADTKQREGKGKEGEEKERKKEEKKGKRVLRTHVLRHQMKIPLPLLFPYLLFPRNATTTTTGSRVSSTFPPRFCRPRPARRQKSRQPPVCNDGGQHWGTGGRELESTFQRFTLRYSYIYTYGSMRFDETSFERNFVRFFLFSLRVEFIFLEEVFI